MKKKGFTLVELLVVIAIIAMLMGILMPALARVRFMAQRVVCGTRLSGIGKSMLTYANDYDQRYVRAGGRDSIWGPLNGQDGWEAETEVLAFGTPPLPGAPGRQATIGSCLYLLIKYADAGAKIFICGGDTGAREFELIDYPGNTVLRQDITEAWDFAGPSDIIGNPPAEHYSYSYHVPFGRIGTSFYPLDSLSDAGMAMAADKSPYLVLNPDSQRFPFMYGGSKEEERYGNSMSHRSEGQNVLFNDGHVSWEEKSYCGVDDDNIYTTVVTDNPMLPTECGADPEDVFHATALPQTKIDSILVNEGGHQGDSGVSPNWVPP